MIALQVWELNVDLQGLQSLPWWWTTLKLLVRRIASVQELAGLSADGKTLPPKNIWLDDDALALWRESQQKKQMPDE